MEEIEINTLLLHEAVPCGTLKRRMTRARACVRAVLRPSNEQVIEFEHCTVHDRKCVPEAYRLPCHMCFLSFLTALRDMAIFLTQ